MAERYGEGSFTNEGTLTFDEYASEVNPTGETQPQNLFTTSRAQYDAFIEDGGDPANATFVDTSSTAALDAFYQDEAGLHGDEVGRVAVPGETTITYADGSTATFATDLNGYRLSEVPIRTTPPTTTLDGTTPVAPVTPEQLPGDDNETASSIIRDALKDYGLEGLLDDTNLRLIDRWVETGDMDAVWAAVRETATYQQRFPGMQALMDAGRAITEGTYVELERQYTSALRAYGMPETFYDSPDDFAALIGGDVSVNEFTQRVATAFQAANQTTPEVRTALESYYGLNDSDLAAYYLDPERAQNIFEERERLGTARIGGIAAETGFGTIARETAERLREAGVTDAQARRGFQAVAQSTLAEETVGDVGDITRAELVGDVFGTDPEAARRVEERRQRRLAEFNQAGGPAMTQGGYVGLGAAT